MSMSTPPLQALEESYSELLALCDGLETVADSLPHAVSARICMSLSARVEALVARTQLLEETALFPLLETSADPRLSRRLARLRSEQLADHSAASEVSEALHDQGNGRKTLSPDAMGYLLRSFFESMRRHVHSEQELIGMLAPRAP